MSTVQGKEFALMEELQPQDIEAPLPKLEEEHGAEEPQAPEVEQF
jgi:hypothetical protein